MCLWQFTKGVCNCSLQSIEFIIFNSYVVFMLNMSVVNGTTKQYEICCFLVVKCSTMLFI